MAGSDLGWNRGHVSWFDKNALLDDFIHQTYQAIHQKISLNPILNQFQRTVNLYQIDHDLIDTFLASMKMDLIKNTIVPIMSNTSWSAKSWFDVFTGVY